MLKLKTVVALKVTCRFKPFQVNVPLPYAVKTSVNERFSNVLTGYIKETELKWVSLWDA